MHFLYYGIITDKSLMFLDIFGSCCSSSGKEIRFEASGSNIYFSVFYSVPPYFLPAISILFLTYC